MPLEYRIDHGRRLVLARGRGTLNGQEIFGYQREVWSRAEVGGYDEVVDMTHVEHLTVPSGKRLKELVELSAGMDLPGTPSKFAVVAPDELASDLARFYKIYRELDPRSTKQVNVFKSLAAALDSLGVESLRE